MLLTNERRAISRNDAPRRHHARNEPSSVNAAVAKCFRTDSSEVRKFRRNAVVRLRTVNLSRIYWKPVVFLPFRHESGGANLACCHFSLFCGPDHPLGWELNSGTETELTAVMSQFQLMAAVNSVSVPGGPQNAATGRRAACASRFNL